MCLTRAYKELTLSPFCLLENQKNQIGIGNLIFWSKLWKKRVPQLSKVDHIAEICKKVHEFLSRISNRFDGKVREPLGSGVFPSPNGFPKELGIWTPFHVFFLVFLEDA